MPSALLRAGAGAADGLDTLIKRRLMEDRMRWEQQHGNDQLQLQRDTLNENTALRKQTEADNAEYRRITQEGLSRDREERNKDRDAQRIMRRVSFRPIGGNVTQPEYDEEIANDIPSDIYDVKDSYASDRGPEQTPTHTINFKGTSAQQNSAESLDLRRQADEARAAAAQANGEATRVRLEQAAERLAVAQKNSDMSRERLNNSEGVTDLDALAQMARETKEQGDKIGWKGIGPITGSLGAFGHDTLGLKTGGGDEGALLRARVERLRTEYSFSKGGKQLTPTERQALDTFLATVDRDPHVASQRLDEFIHQIDNRRQQVQSHQLGGTTVRPMPSHTPTAAPTSGRRRGRFIVEDVPEGQ